MSEKISSSLDDHEDEFQSERTAVAGESRRKNNSLQKGRRSVEEYAERSISIQEINSSVQRLTVEEQKMFHEYEEERTFEEIAQEIDRTKPRAKQIVDKVIGKFVKP